MKKNFLMMASLLVLGILFFMYSCEKDSGASVDDPDGTITVSINDGNNMRIFEGMASKPYSDIYHYYPYVTISLAITTSTLNTNFATTVCPDAMDLHGLNFYDSGAEAANIGAVNGLGNVTSIPNSGYSVRCAFEKGHGYVVRYKKSYDQSDPDLPYFYGRFYVVDWLTSASNGGVIGVTIKFQGPF